MLNLKLARLKQIFEPTKMEGKQATDIKEHIDIHLSEPFWQELTFYASQWMVTGKCFQAGRIMPQTANSAHPPAAWQSLCQQKGFTLTPFSGQESNPQPEQICQKNFQNHIFNIPDIYIWVMVELNDLIGLFQPLRFSDFSVSKCILKPEDIWKWD